MSGLWEYGRGVSSRGGSRFASRWEVIGSDWESLGVVGVNLPTKVPGTSMKYPPVSSIKMSEWGMPLPSARTAGGGSTTTVRPLEYGWGVSSRGGSRWKSVGVMEELNNNSVCL